MGGELCVVTGATSGIGKATATALARLGAQVVLVARDRGRGEATAAEVAAAGASPPRLEIADLASMAQVRALAGRLGALERIDVLVNNAGLMAGQRRATADGLDEVFAVNHLAPFLLTSLLLGQLTAAAPARVITVTSGAHAGARLDLDDPQLERGWESWRAYANSKLANILFTRELARRLEGTGVTANCAHPGVVRTRFGREARLPMRAAVTLGRPFMLSPRRGADTIVYLATSPEVAGASGGYYVKRQRREPSAAARDDATAQRLWQLSEELTGLAPARPAGT
jgi:NAD(P)-dependent dehydrogenase (short-subunit alcohol dehydrogenase family)